MHRVNKTFEMGKYLFQLVRDVLISRHLSLKSSLISRTKHLMEFSFIFEIAKTDVFSSMESSRDFIWILETKC